MPSDPAANKHSQLPSLWSISLCVSGLKPFPSSTALHSLRRRLCSDSLPARERGGGVGQLLPTYQVTALVGCIADILDVRYLHYDL